MTDKITRYESLVMKLLLQGESPWLIREAIHSTALSKPAGWLEELVDAETGERVGP